MRSTPEVIIITGHGDSDSAELAMKSGVWDFIQKPCSLSSMRLILTRALQYREKKGLATKPPVLLKLDKLVGSSSQLRGCFDLVAQAAQSDINVLITERPEPVKSCLQERFMTIARGLERGL